VSCPRLFLVCLLGFSLALVACSSATPGPETAPPMPTSIVGFTPHESPVNVNLRIFDGTPTPIDGFPVTMNGCSQGRSTTRWRSLSGPVTAGITSFADHPDNIDPTIIRARTTAQAGLVATDNQCDQPVFLTEKSAGPTDVVIEYQDWWATP
jgi:hypothetical protein